MKKSTEMRVPLTGGHLTTALLYAARDEARGALVLAHGAGAGQQHPFMVSFADAIAARGIDVVTFNFLYMEQKRRIPDRGPILEDCYHAVIEHVRADVPSAARGLVIGGKSMGGRIATQMAAAEDAPGVDGIVLLGYPLHPPGRPDQRRDAHLPRVRRPMLFVQGTRDSFGTVEEMKRVVAGLNAATLVAVEGGDHSFKLGRKDPAAQAAAYDHVQQIVTDWLYSVFSSTSPAGVNP